MKVRTLLTSLLFVVSILCSASCVFKASTSTSAENANAAPTPDGTPVAASGEVPLPPPESLVADLYKAHDGKKSPFFQTKDRALVDKYFTKPLADLIWKDANNSSGEVGAIDGDPLYNAQDMEIKNFSIGKGDVKGDTATVIVTFTNYDQKQSLTYSLKTVGNAWKIDNISYGGGDSLMKWLKDTYDKPATANTSTEFEGKYIVGDTTCIVKPSKQAFEVRWAKGSGVEMFFAEGDNTFMSNPESGDANSFEFDDANYNTGRFLRGDGKTFAVKRAK